MKLREKIEFVAIEKIFPNTWNPNEQSDFIFEKEKESIRRFGMIDPVTVREIPEGFEIIDGEHRYLACKALEHKEVPVNNLGEVSDSVAQQLTVIFNETKGKSKRVELSALLQKIVLSVPIEDLKLVMPFTENEMTSFLSQGAIEWSNLSAEKPAEEHAPDESDWVTVSYKVPKIVAENFKIQVDRFKKALVPDQAPDKTSPVQALEAITQHLSHVQDDQLA